MGVLASVEKRIYDFLQLNKLKDFCDNCIAGRVSRPDGGTVNPSQVRNATSAFEVTREFTRSLGTCPICQENKKVIRAL
jgi:hypothetical protein